MTHVITNKKKLILRVRRIRGQVEGVERALDSDEDCVKIIQAISSIRGALTGLMGEVLESHIAEHVVDRKSKPNPEQIKGVKELLKIIKTYVK